MSFSTNQLMKYQCKKERKMSNKYAPDLSSPKDIMKSFYDAHMSLLYNQELTTLKETYKRLAEQGRNHLDVLKQNPKNSTSLKWVKEYSPKIEQIKSRISELDSGDYDFDLACETMALDYITSVKNISDPNKRPMDMGVIFSTPNLEDPRILDELKEYLEFLHREGHLSIVYDFTDASGPVSELDYLPGRDIAVNMSYHDYNNIMESIDETESLKNIAKSSYVILQNPDFMNNRVCMAGMYVGSYGGSTSYVNDPEIFDSTAPTPEQEKPPVITPEDTLACLGYLAIKVDNASVSKPLTLKEYSDAIVKGAQRVFKLQDYSSDFSNEGIYKSKLNLKDYCALNYPFEASVLNHGDEGKYYLNVIDSYSLADFNRRIENDDIEMGCAM